MIMAEQAGRAALEALDLTPGCELVLDGVAWQVESVEAHHGQVLLRGADGERRQVTIRWLLNHPGRRWVRPDGRSSTAQGRQAPVMEDLTPTRQEQLRLRVAHLLEAQTGFRSGDRGRALPGEPRAAYDPAITTLGQRRRAKVAELGRLGRDEARMLGLEQVSERTLERLAAAYQRFGIIGCVDGRWLRRGGGHPSVSEELREAIDAVHAETLHRSKVSMRTRERPIHQYVREKFGAQTPIPHYDTLRVVWAEWFGSGASRST